MNIRKAVVSTLATSAILIGMTGGIALADEMEDPLHGQADVAVNYGCGEETASVSVAVDGPMEVDPFDLDPFWGVSGSATENVHITLDLTCNFSAQFEVTANIGDFEYTGDSNVDPFYDTSFGGEKFYMNNGHVSDTNVPIWPGFTAVPDVASEAFFLNDTEEEGIIQDQDIFSPWYVNIWLASPGVTTATWDSHVINVGNGLVPGEYVAPLTVDLTVN